MQDLGSREGIAAKSVTIGLKKKEHSSMMVMNHCLNHMLKNQTR